MKWPKYKSLHIPTREEFDVEMSQLDVCIKASNELFRDLTAHSVCATLNMSLGKRYTKLPYFAEYWNFFNSRSMLIVNYWRNKTCHNT